MNFTDRLFVEIVPMKTGQIPHPHPIDEGHFDPALIYKVLGLYNPSETSECYFMLANPQRQIWFIPQRHLRAFALLDSDEFFLTAEQAGTIRRQPAERNGRTAPATRAAGSPPLANGEDHPGARETAGRNPQTPKDSTLPPLPASRAGRLHERR